MIFSFHADTFVLLFAFSDRKKLIQRPFLPIVLSYFNIFQVKIQYPKHIKSPGISKIPGPVLQDIWIYAMATSRAIFIMVVKVSCLSSAVVASPVKGLSEMVQMARAFLPALAAFI